MTDEKAENIALGNRLRELIKVYSLTQTSLSQIVEVKQGYLNQIIMGHKRISATVILNIAKGFKEIDLRWLLLGDGEMIANQPAYIIQVKEPDPGYDDSVENILRDHERRLRALEKKIPLIE